MSTLMLLMDVSCARSSTRLRDDRRVLRVEVGDHALVHRIALHRHRERVALVVQDPDLAGPGLRLPEDVPRHLHAGDVLADLVVAPPDAVEPDDVGHAVARAAVVERVLQRCPDVLLEVGQVAVRERQHQLLGEQGHLVVGAEPDDDVEAHAARRELGGRLVGGVVGRDLDLAVELLLEALDEARPDVVGVVEDLQRAALGLQAFLDLRVVVGDRPRHAVVRTRQRQAVRSGRPRDDELLHRRSAAALAGSDRLRGVLAPGRDAGHAHDGPGAEGAAHQVAPGEPVFAWMHSVARSPRRRCGD